MFERPTLSFKEARLPHVDFRGAELDLVFLVTNPNSVGLDLTRAGYDLEVEGHKVAAGTPKNGLKIPGGATTEVTFPANVQWNEIAPALEALFAMNQVHYKASGELGVGAVTLPLSHEGTFAAPKMPKIDVGSPQITSLMPPSSHFLRISTHRSESPVTMLRSPRSLGFMVFSFSTMSTK